VPRIKTLFKFGAIRKVSIQSSRCAFQLMTSGWSDEADKAAYPEWKRRSQDQRYRTGNGR
jgi:hypothetical protein